MADPNIEIRHGGRVVQGIFQLEFDSRARVVIQAIRGRRRPQQGISLRVEAGKLRVGDEDHKRVVCWFDHRPWWLDLEVLPTRRKVARLRIWNSWMIDGGANAWLNDCGMIVEPIGERKWRFECSDGWGPPNFSDFIFELEIRDSASGPG